MAELTPLYTDEPAKLKALHNRLTTMYAGDLPDIDALDAEGVVHTADFDKDWTITLRSSAAGQLLAASAVRRGVERYDFEQTGFGDWAARDARSRFADTHFFTLVNMATQEGLDWEVAPAA